VPEACRFVEEAYPPTGTFGRLYETWEWRWAETLIRALTWFFYREIGQFDDAKTFRYYQGIEGVSALDVFIAALTPWWQDRLLGKAPPLEEVLHELPHWLRAARKLDT
jgi:hypothetical protein